MSLGLPWLSETVMKTIEYFYSTRSIYAYFGSERVMTLAQRFGRRLVHHPIDLSKVVPAAGSLPFAQRSAAHKAYQFGRKQWDGRPHL